MGKNCVDCKSWTAGGDTVAQFGRTIGVPMCARYGTPLRQPHDPSNEDVSEAIATGCSAFNKFKPTKPINFDGLTIAFPDPDRIVPGPSWEREAVTACTMCKNYVDEGIVQRELGYGAGFCMARGRLIMANRTREEASGCYLRGIGEQPSSTQGAMLKPVYQEGFMVPASDPVAAFMAGGEPRDFVEPTTYTTDRPVTPEEEAEGIRAWRQVFDPEDCKRFTYLPIFRMDFFSEEEQAKIPKTGDDEHPELYKDHGGLLYQVAVMWRELDETPALWGDAGTGKTELGRHLAWIMCLPFERISITGSSELDDLAGKMMYDPDKGTFPQYGRIPKAWNKPCILLVDEPNTGPPPVWQFLRPLTDNSRQLVLDWSNGERIKRSDQCYLMLAMNPAWDPRNRGAEEIADADASRLMHIFVTLPPEDIEKKIITDRVALDGWKITSRQLAQIMAIAKDIRGLVKNQTIPISWGLRPQIQVARAIRWYDPVTAYRRVIADFMEPESAEVLLAAVRAHIS